MGALYLGGRKGEGEVPPPSLCFYKVSLDTLRDDVFTVVAESSDLCLSAAEVRVQMVSFFLYQYWSSNNNGMADTGVLLGSKASIFSFFSQKHTHTHTLTVSFDNRDADIISYPVVLPPGFHDTTEVQNKCTVWTTAKDVQVRVQIYPKLLNSF